MVQKSGQVQVDIYIYIFGLKFFSFESNVFFLRSRFLCQQKWLPVDNRCRPEL